MCVCVCVCARACVRMYSSNFTIHQFLKCPGNPTKCLTGFKISYNKYVFTIRPKQTIIGQKRTQERKKGKQHIFKFLNHGKSGMKEKKVGV